jgi:outer membrane protein TolC
MLPHAIALPALSLLFAIDLNSRQTTETNVAGGLTADEAARRAVATSGEVAARAADVESAAAAVAQSDVAFFPRLSADARYTRLSSIVPPVLGLTVVAPGAPIGPLPSGTTLVNAPVSFPVLLDQTSFHATLSVPVSDYLFRLGPLHAAATRTEAAARATEEASRRRAAADTKVLYYEWARARLARLVQDAAVAQTRGHLEDARRAFDAGAASQADVLRVEAQLATAEQAAARAQALAVALEARLRTAMHLPSAAPSLAIGEALDRDFVSTATARDLDRLSDEAARARPELRALDATIAALDRQSTATARLAIPAVAVIGEATDANPNLRYIPSRDRFDATWSVTAQLTWSPNDATTAHEAGRALAAKRAAAEGDRRALLDAVRAEIAGALQAVDVARSAQLTTARGLVSAEESYRVRRALFQNAHATSVELTDAETELTRAWLDRVSAHIDARIADVALRHAIGGDGVAPAIATPSRNP